jgi:hypothetical protein
MCDDLFRGWEDLTFEQKQERIESRSKYIEYLTAELRLAKSKLSLERTHHEHGIQ